MKYNLGLDLGVASVGWAVMVLDEDLNPSYLKDTGVVVVESMEEGTAGNLKSAARRDRRGSRRVLRRRQHRVKRMYSRLSKEFAFESIDDVYNEVGNNVYEIKVRGLSSKLTPQELTVALLHYSKHRGFKSNRKEGNTSKDDGVVLEAIEKNKDRLGDKYISELLLEELDGKTKIKNTSGSYNYSFAREQYLKEITKLLENQCEYYDFTEGFIKDVIKIWSSQRDFSDGPGGESEYKVDFADTFGYCKFMPTELRAPRFSYSQEKNTMLSKLVNLRFKEKNILEYKKLTPTQVVDLYEIGSKKPKLLYSDVIKYLKNTELKFKGNRISKEDYIKCLKECSKKTGEKEVNTSSDEFQKILSKKENSRTIGEMKANNELRKVFKNHGGLELYENLPTEYKDDIAVGLTFYKTDGRIMNYFKGNAGEDNIVVSELDWELYPQIVNEVIPIIKDTVFKESASLSLKLLRKLNVIMIDGVEYSEAMTRLGYDHSIIGKEVKKKDRLDPVVKILEEQYPNEISNPRVVRVLSKTGSVINSCIKKYGMPYNINIEVARDINLTMQNRMKIQNEQLNNLTVNERIKAKILSNGQRASYSQITKYDIEKYKLFDEQNGICSYSMTPIEEGNLLTEMYEVDHIIPYSKGNINNFNNKTLVCKAENQNKRNVVPLTYLRTKETENPDIVNQYKEFISKNYNMSDLKKSYYLTNSMDDLPEGFGERDLADTRFITKYLVNILENNLKFEGEKTRKAVNSYKAGYVNFFKQACRINNYTHSLESVDYKRRTELVIKGIEYQSKDFGIKLVVTDLKNGANYEVNVKAVKENDKIPEHQIRLNDALKTIHEKNHLIDMSVFTDTHLQKFGSILVDIFDVLQEELASNEEVLYAYEFAIAYLKAEVTKQTLKKNRNNHLHHALDAVATATMSKSIEQKLAEYSKKRELVLEAIAKKGHVVLEMSEGPIGITSKDEYAKIEWKYLNELIPLPYDNYQTEIQALIYEMNMDKKSEMLNNDEKYNIRPMIPVQTKKKRYEIKNGKVRTQRLHKDTLMGACGNSTTKRIDVSELNTKKAEKIAYKDTGSKNVYDACVKWFAEKKPTEYPRLKSGRDIKKVTILEGDLDKALNIGRGYVAADETVRIDVYQKEGEESLYFLQQNALTIVKDYAGEEINQSLWYGQGNKKLDCTNKQIKKQFKCVYKLHPGDLIKLKKKTGESGYGYVKGFSSGQLEIGSVIGDNYDFNYSFDLSNLDSRLKITISTIEKIEKIKIDICGEMSS